MKKILLLFSAFLIGFAVNAQADCDPNDAEQFGELMYPDPETNFQDACLDEPYEQLIFFIVPTDTVIEQDGATADAIINYVSLDSIIGIPTGLTIESNPDDAVFPGGTHGCAVMSGVPTEEGHFQMTVYVTIQATVGPFTQTEQRSYDGYFIIVNDCDDSGVKENKGLETFVVYPNPARDEVTITNLSQDGITKEISIYNTEGKLVKNHLTTSVYTTVSIAELKAGIYFIEVLQNGTTEISKLIVE